MLIKVDLQLEKRELSFNVQQIAKRMANSANLKTSWIRLDCYMKQNY